MTYQSDTVAKCDNAAKRRKICTKAFTEPQDDWGPQEYGFLFARIERFFNDTEKFKPAIESLDLAEMTNTTKLIMRSTLLYYGTLDKTIAAFPNLEGIRNAKTLKNPLQISSHPYGRFKEFENAGLLL
jgi:hypothetical protein